jgi:hypothetical protein
MSNCGLLLVVDGDFELELDPPESIFCNICILSFPGICLFIIDAIDDIDDIPDIEPPNFCLKLFMYESEPPIGLDDPIEPNDGIELIPPMFIFGIAFVPYMLIKAFILSEPAAAGAAEFEPETGIGLEPLIPIDDNFPANLGLFLKMSLTFSAAAFLRIIQGWLENYHLWE